MTNTTTTIIISVGGINMNIKELRTKKKYTQNQVAKLVGISLTAFRLWEEGVMKPNEENLAKLKKVLEK